MDKDEEIKRLRKELQTYKIEDSVCDWLTRFYNEVLIKLLHKSGYIQYSNWNDVRADLYEDYDDSIKQICCNLCGITLDEWNLLYELKKRRNSRCHPRREWDKVWSMIREYGDENEEDTRECLTKIMGLLRIHVALI